VRVLLIEDDIGIARTVELVLAKDGVICDRVELGGDGLQLNKLYNYDLVILDIMLPDMDGYNVLKQLRHSRSDVPILILSTINTSEQKIRGLGFGADDFLTKPFDQEELLARIRAIVRRSKGHSSPIIKIGKLIVSLDTHTTMIGDNTVRLTTKEQDMLEIMALRRGQIISKEVFLSQLYNGIDEPEAKIVDVFICKIRKKLMKASGGVNFIETIWGRGYCLTEGE
jgi:two-component system cell cycle response regulator CtrA